MAQETGAARYGHPLLRELEPELPHRMRPPGPESLSPTEELNS